MIAVRPTINYTLLFVTGEDDIARFNNQQYRSCTVRYMAILTFHRKLNSVVLYQPTESVFSRESLYVTRPHYNSRLVKLRYDHLVAKTTQPVPSRYTRSSMCHDTTAGMVIVANRQNSVFLNH
jgi:hypothetical protein